MTYKQEEIKPYSADGAKEKQVEDMFDNIAHSYDTLNHRMSWNIDKRWRRKSLALLKQNNPKSILDIATGTGDYAIMAAKMLHPDSLVGVDISEGMMAVGKRKVHQEGLDKIIEFKKEDCLNMSFADNSFDSVISAFGIRNFTDLEKGLYEMCRVLKPGGRLVIAELTTPVSHPMKELYKIYSHIVLPVYGRLISKDKSAYSYLIATIEAFPQGEQMVEILQKVGFREAGFRRLTFGICTMYFATK